MQPTAELRQNFLYALNVVCNDMLRLIRARRLCVNPIRRSVDRSRHRANHKCPTSLTQRIMPQVILTGVVKRCRP